MGKQDNSLIEQYAKDVTYFLRKSVKHKGGLLSWLNKLKKDHALTERTPGFYGYVAAKLLRMDEIILRYGDRQDDFLNDTKDLWKEVELYSKKLNLLIAYKNGVNLIEPPTNLISKYVDVNVDSLNHNLNEASFSKISQCLIKLSPGNEMMIGQLNEEFLDEMEVKEVYFRLLPKDELTRVINEARTATDNQDEINLLQRVDAMVTVTLYAECQNSASNGGYCEDYVLLLREGYSIIKEVHNSIYQYELPLAKEEAIRKLFNLIFRIVLDTNDQLINSESTLLTSKIELKL